MGKLQAEVNIMVDNDNEAGRQAVQRAAAARNQETLGPGTAGYTTSGAAYRGKEIAASMGVPGPEEVGFTSNTGLGYADEGVETGFAKAQHVEGEVEVDRDGK